MARNDSSLPFLVLGTGAREHAIAWRLREDGHPVFLHPGNAGTAARGFQHFESDLPDNDAEALAARCREHGIQYVVVGPERLLADGLADRLRAQGLFVVGPGREAAQLESSKVFAKKFLEEANIPTAKFRVVHSAAELREAVGGKFPNVVKLDGLAAGKGVVVAHGADDVASFANRVWTQQEFGAGPHTVVVEDFLAGREVSYIGFCDGRRFVPLPSASDYKRLEDDDKGPNTGGMGAVSPSPWLDAALEKRIRDRIIDPVLDQLGRRNLSYRGILYVGVIVSEAGDPYVLEFNARFGDPETQATLLRFEEGFAECLQKTAAGELDKASAPRFSNDRSVYVVAAAEGYPVQPRSGDFIEGVDRVPAAAQIFFAGVAEREGRLVTAGGRVLGVGTLGHDFESARDAAYRALGQVKWPGMQTRGDIGIVETR